MRWILPLNFGAIDIANTLAGGVSATENTIIVAKDKKTLGKENIQHNKQTEKIINNNKTL